jgi:ppGpp synthetase/RelA/SpoT-type nucleotidyltranferase
MSEDKFFASQISHSAEYAERNLLAILKTAELQDKCYAFKTRVKSWKKLLTKVELKREKKPQYCLADITDVLGLRIVTLFRQDMIEVIDTVLSLISHQLPYNPIPFEKDSLKEAIIYSPSVKNDTIISQAAQKIQSYGLLERDEIKLEPSAARYSSIHLVAYMESEVPDFKDTYKVPVEIQIRTVFEDAWGELDHKYGYQNREGKSEAVITNPIHVQKNLLTMKRFVDACSEYADNIRDLATESELDTRTVRPLDTDELIIGNLKESGIAIQFIDDYMKVRELRASAEGSPNQSQMYLNAAENFKELLEQTLLNTDIEHEEGFATYYFYIKMDEALCRLSTSDSIEIEKALTIYKDLIKNYSNYPVIRFRMGQSLIRLKEFEDARKQLKKCRSDVVKLSEFPEERRKVNLPNIELNKLQIGLYLLLGFAYWKEAAEIFKSSRQSRRVKSFLEQAFKQTQPALNVEDISLEHKTKLINNMVYYALEIVHFKKLNGNCEEYDSFIRENLSFLESNTDIGSSENVNALDTLMNCYLYLKSEKEAVLVAQRLEKLSLDSNIEGKSLIDKSVLKTVKEVLNSRKDVDNI